MENIAQISRQDSRAHTLQVDLQNKEAWPGDQDEKVETLSEFPTVLQTQFDDIDQYHPRLIERVLELEKDENFTHRMHIGGSKVRSVHEWGIPEAEFINERAVNFFARAMDQSQVAVQLSWASITRKNEYLSIHSHDNCLGSLVYMLTPGNPDPDSHLDGRLALADPRLAECCDREAGRVTKELVPDMKAGAMVLFSSEVMHHVHPYTGDQPRITIAWNFHIAS